jgi:hypothetical protein
MMYDDSNHAAGDDDTPLDPNVLEAARDYHAPPSEVPREAMWSAIQASRATAPQPTREPVRPIPVHDSGRGSWLRRRSWPVAIAAGIVLASGVAIGRWSLEPRITTNVTALVTPTVRGGRFTNTADGAAYQVAVARDLTQAEALLTAFRTEPQPSRDAPANAELATWARDVLSNTRLLIDSPAAADPQRRRLLEDLELVLVQMVELAPDRSGAERQMIDSTLEHDHVLSRLRYAVPAGATGI